MVVNGKKEEPGLLDGGSEIVLIICLTQEWLDNLGVMTNEFLWLEECKLVAQILCNNELGLAWDESEKGRFRDDYLSLVVIPTIKHIPWVQ